MKWMWGRWSRDAKKMTTVLPTSVLTVLVPPLEVRNIGQHPRLGSGFYLVMIGFWTH